MNRRPIVFLAVLCACTMAFAQVSFEQADLLYFTDKPQESKQLLLDLKSQASTADEEAQALWRLARVQVTLGDNIPKSDKAARFAAYEEGQAYAEQSIAVAPGPMGYLWKASNVGRWGQTKGALNSLSKAKPMDADLRIVINDFGCLDSSEAWYVLASLYDQLPGKPMSFGNSQTAISFARAAVDTIPSNVIYPGTYQGLAEMLWKRNWNIKKRTTEIAKLQDKWDSATDDYTKYGFYEGKLGVANQPYYSSVQLGQMSDRQEAVMLLLYAQAVYKSRAFHSQGDIRNMEEIDALVQDWYAQLSK